MLNPLFEDEIIRKSILQIAEVAGYLWDKGWAERNAGNISVNVTDKIQRVAQKHPEDILPTSRGAEFPMPISYPGLAGQWLLITGTGSRMRNLHKHPEENLCFMHIGPDGTSYQLICNDLNCASLRPTSELPTHLAIHEMLVLKDATEKAVVHTHARELIALTQIRELKDEAKINHIIWGMHPETVVFLPEGVGFIPYTLPGSSDIAAATIEKLNDHRVVLWEKHGCLAIGPDVVEAFDSIDIVAKSIQIFFTCRNAGFKPEGLDAEKIEEIRRNYCQDN